MCWSISIIHHLASLTHLQPVSLMIFSMSFNSLLSLRADTIDLFHFLETLQPFSVGLRCLLNMEHPGRSPHWPQTGWSVHVISYQKWPVQLCWNGILGQVWLFWAVIAILFTWNITFMLHWRAWEHTYFLYMLIFLHVFGFTQVNLMHWKCDYCDWLDL